MSFRASIFAAATVFASLTSAVAATASIARAQATAPRFKVLVIAERLDPGNADRDEIHRPYVEQPKSGSPTLLRTATSPSPIWSRPIPSLAPCSARWT
jgi:hypothetical protein